MENKKTGLPMLADLSVELLSLYLTHTLRPSEVM